jgi:hypothetical protein
MKFKVTQNVLAAASTGVVMLSIISGCRENTSSAPAGVSQPVDQKIIPVKWQREFDLSFASSISDLKQAPDGSVWIARTESNAPDSPSQVTFEKYDSDGKLIRSFKSDPGTTFASMAFHPSGAITVGELIPIQSSLSFSLNLHRSSDEGLTDQVADFSKLALTPEDDQLCAGPPNTFLGNQSFSIAPVGENIAVGAFSCSQFTLYLFDPQLRLLWSKRMSPVRGIDFYLRLKVIQLPSGSLAVGMDTGAAGRSTVVIKFLSAKNENLPAKGGFVLALLDPADGRTLSAFAVETPESWFFGDFVAQAQEFWLVGSSYVKQDGVPSEKIQSKLAIAKADIETGHTEWSQVIQIDHNDKPSSVALVGNRLVIGGSTGVTQANTGSVITYPKGFVAVFDSNGTMENSWEFPGTRGKEISCVLYDSAHSQLLAAGIDDAPITHSGDSDRSQLHSKSFLQSLSEPIMNQN